MKVFGDGLEKGIVDEPNTFTIETKNAGAGGLGLAIEGPSEALMQCEDNKDGTATGKGGKLEKVLGCVNPASCVSFLRVLTQPVSYLLAVGFYIDIFVRLGYYLEKPPEIPHTEIG